MAKANRINQKFYIGAMHIHSFGEIFRLRILMISKAYDKRISKSTVSSSGK